MSATPSTTLANANAADAGLLNCHACGLLSEAPLSQTLPHVHLVDDPDHGGDALCCPRCGAELHVRKPHSLARTWAYLLAACVLYIPANVLPMMQTNALFDRQRDTILSGVVYLWNDGSWVLALIVFIASIVIPLAKLTGLAYLLITVQLGERRRLRQRTRLYRLIERVGRWSMLDIYVVTLLAALVQLEPLALINVGPGAMAFGAVVVLTILATHAFDPRLIWDAAKKSVPEIDEDEDLEDDD